MKKIQGIMVIGIMCFLLSYGISVQIKSIKNDSTVIAKENAENELRDQVLELSDKYNKKYDELEKKQNKLDKLRENASNNSVLSESWSKNLSKINNYLGLTDVKGKGLIIEIETGDLLLVINALNNAGAEAISINDKRIIFNSEILNDGDIVQLDGIMLEKPYTIKAIGSSALYGAITMPESYIDKLKKSDFKVNIQQKDDIIIKKYEGIYNFNFAKNIEN